MVLSGPILVTGASGFVGGWLTHHLLEQGHSVLALSRHPPPRQERLTPVQGDVVTGQGLEAVKSAAAVIHLVGIIREHGESTFEKVHVEGTRNVLAAAREAGVERFIHMSALGAQQGSPSRYFDTKAQAEALVRESGLGWTVLRPSLIFGQGDDFFGHVLKDLVTSGPVIPQIGDGHFPLRPVWIGDVVRTFAQSIERSAAIKQSFELVGPTEYTFAELLRLMKQALGVRKPIIPVPLPLMRAALPLLQRLPAPPLTRDQFLMLLAGSTGNPQRQLEVFDLPMATLPEKLPEIVQAGARLSRPCYMR
jgi:NADH dehydrogenase